MVLASSRSKNSTVQSAETMPAGRVTPSAAKVRHRPGEFVEHAVVQRPGRIGRSAVVFEREIVTNPATLDVGDTDAATQ